MISANGGLPAHRYTPQVTQRWPRGSEPASVQNGLSTPGRKPTLPHSIEQALFEYVDEHRWRDKKA